MKLKNGETVWIPGEEVGMMCVLAKGQNPPVNLASYLSHQVKILERLIREDEEQGLGEMEQAEYQLKNNLPYEVRMMLPPKCLRQPDGPRRLIEDLIPSLADAGTPQQERLSAARETIQQQMDPMPQDEARKYAEELSLAQYVVEQMIY